MPAAGPRLTARAPAVVQDGDLDVRSDAYDADLGPGVGARVFLRVGQGLLDDPVGGQVDGGRQRGAVVGARHLDREPCVAEGAGEFVETAEAGSGFGGGLGVVGLAEQAHGGAQLVERRTAGLADVGEGLLGLVGPLVHDVRRDPGLHVDQRDVVGDHVVQIAGDAQPLLGDAAAGLLLTGALGAFGALPDGLDDRAAAAYGVPGGRADAGPGEHAQVLLGVPGQGAAEHGGGGQHGHGEQADAPGGGAVGGRGDGVEGDDGGHGDRGARVAGEELDQGDGPGDGEDRLGSAAAEDERGGAEGHQEQAERVRGADAPGDAVVPAGHHERADDHAHQYGGGDGRVQCEGVRLETAPGALESAHLVNSTARCSAGQQSGAGAGGPTPGRSPALGGRPPVPPSGTTARG